MAEDPPKLYVIQLDTRNKPSADISCYKESMVPADFFTKLKDSHPRTISYKSQVASMCGRDITIHFTNYSEGYGQAYRRGGEAGVISLIQSNPGILSKNNGAATYLTMNPVNGLCEYIVCGRAYVLEDDGRTPLSKGQLWGIVEMINCACDIYDLDPDSMQRGHEKMQIWCEQHKHRKFMPPSGTGGVDIYSSRR